MQCIDPRKIDARNPEQFQKMIQSHKWNVAHFDKLEERGILVRYACRQCSQEWTSLIPFNTESRGYREVEATIQV